MCEVVFDYFFFTFIPIILFLIQLVCVAYMEYAYKYISYRKRQNMGASLIPFRVHTHTCTRTLHTCCCTPCCRLLLNAATAARLFFCLTYIPCSYFSFLYKSNSLFGLKISHTFTIKYIWSSV